MRFNRPTVITSVLFALMVCVTALPPATFADVPFTQVVGDLTTSNLTVTATNLQGASACAIDVTGTWAGVITPEVVANSTWTGVPVATVGSTSTLTTITSNGTYNAPCAAMRGIRARFSTPTSGTAHITINTAPGVAYKPPTGVASIAGVAPIYVNTAGGVSTVSISPVPVAPTPVSVVAGNSNVTVATPSPGVFSVAVATATPVSVQAGANVSVATPAPGVFVVSAITPSPAPTAIPISVQAGANVTVATPVPGTFVVAAVTAAPPSITSANSNLTVATPSANTYVLTAATAAPPSITAGTGIAVATPSSNTYVVSNTGVTAVTGSGNISSSGGQTPNVTITNAPTYTGPVNANGFMSNGANPYFSTGGGQSGTAQAFEAGSANSDTRVGLVLQNSQGSRASAVGTNSGATVSTVVGQCLTIADVDTSYSVVSNLATFDCSGNEGLAGTYYGAASTMTGTVTAGSVADSALSTNKCVGTAASTALASATNCISSISTGNSNHITVSNSSSSVTLDFPATIIPTNITVPGVTTIGTQNSYTGAGGYIDLGNGFTGGFTNIFTSTTTLAGVGGNCLTLALQGGATVATMDCAGNWGAASYSATNLVSGDCLQATTNGKVASLANPCVGAITAGNDIVISGTVAAPTVAVTAAPGFTSVTVTGATASQCLGTNGSKVLTSSGEACPTSYQGGVRLGGLHVEVGGGSVSLLATQLYTFGGTYATAPTCSVATVGAEIAPTVSIVSGFPTTTQVEVYNSSGSAVSAAFTCFGW